MTLSPSEAAVINRGEKRQEFGRQRAGNKAGKIVCSDCGEPVKRSDATADGYEYKCPRCAE